MRWILIIPWCENEVSGLLGHFAAGISVSLFYREKHVIYCCPLSILKSNCLFSLSFFPTADPLPGNPGLQRGRLAIVQQALIVLELTCKLTENFYVVRNGRQCAIGWPKWLFPYIYWQSEANHKQWEKSIPCGICCGDQPDFHLGHSTASGHILRE